MGIRSSLVLLIITIISVWQPDNGFSESIGNDLQVKTHFGTFHLPVPILRLPDLPEMPLVSVSRATFPELPDWHFPRFIPDEPSWLDRPGNFYKEGIYQCPDNYSD